VSSPGSWGLRIIVFLAIEPPQELSNELGADYVDNKAKNIYWSIYLK